MAAVAAEPGAAAAATTTAGDVGDVDPVLPVPRTDMVSNEPHEYVPVLDLVHHLQDADAVQECGQVQLVSRPDREAAGKALEARADDEALEAGCLRVGGGETTEHDALELYDTGYTLAIGERLIDRYSPVVEALNEVSKKQDSRACRHTAASDSQPSVVFLHSFPAHPLATEAGLSLAELAEPSIDYYQNPEPAQHDVECDYRALIKPTLDGEMEPDSGDDVHFGTEYKDAPSEEALLERSQPMMHALEPEVVMHALEPEPMMDALEPEVMHALEPEQVMYALEPEQVKDALEPEQVKDALEPEQVKDALEPEQVKDALEPEQVKDALEPEQVKDALEPEQVKDALEPEQVKDALEPEPVSKSQACLGTSTYICDFSSVEQQNSGESRNFLPESQSESKPAVLCHVGTADIPPGSVDQLTPGSEVRVCLDHIIDDALVVSFRLGEKIFSGVLMDLSKRFGPYGIPITVFPKREHKDKPESMQIITEPPAEQTQPDPEILQNQDDQPPSQAEPAAPPQPAGATPAPSSHVVNPPAPPHPWTSRPPPLFQEGAPYPPPLFIRDTYNQSLPQPPPRKIRRPKRRLYREEPTSIMNAIKLRPRQVLCDKCKGVVGGDKRETAPRRAPVSDSRGDDAKRRRSDSSAAPVGKRPRNDPREEKGRGAEPKRHGAASSNVRTTNSASSSSSLGHGRGGASGNRVLRGVSSSPVASTLPNSGSSRVQVNAKKVLQGKSSIVDHTKAREVLKLARVQRRQRETPATPTPLASTVSTNAHPKTMTRSAALQEAHQNQKVHFTRRLQQISGMGPVNAAPLPPRMRIKPQRYRNEENQASSPPKVPGPEKGPAGQAGSRLSPPKPASCLAKAATPVPGLASVLVPGTGLASAPVPTLDPASAPMPDPLLALDPTPGFSSPQAPSPVPPSAPSHVLTTEVARCSTTTFLCLSSCTAEASVSQPQSPPGESKPQVELFVQASPEVGVPGVKAEDQGGQEERQGAHGSKVSTSSNLVVLMTLDSRPPLPLPDSSSSTSRCSVDSADELKSSRSSECSSTETFEFPPTGEDSPTLPPPPAPGPSSSSGPGDDADTPPPPASPPKDEDAKKRHKSSKADVFSKSVSKCVSVEGRTTCVGDIVWAKIYGFPWWPARVVGISISRRDTGLLVRQEARVSWFGSPTTSFLPLTQLAPFLESFQSRFDKKRRGLYRKAITEAARAAKQLTPEVRALLTQFET